MPLTLATLALFTGAIVVLRIRWRRLAPQDKASPDLLRPRPCCPAALRVCCPHQHHHRSPEHARLLGLRPRLHLLRQPLHLASTRVAHIAGCHHAPSPFALGQRHLSPRRHLFTPTPSHSEHRRRSRYRRGCHRRDYPGSLRCRYRRLPPSLLGSASSAQGAGRTLLQYAVRCIRLPMPYYCPTIIICEWYAPPHPAPRPPTAANLIVALYSH